VLGELMLDQNPVIIERSIAEETKYLGGLRSWTRPCLLLAAAHHSPESQHRGRAFLQGL
jgi:hypothetical protein